MTETKSTTVPAECRNAVARYEAGGEVHTIEGHPADHYVQLDLLCDLARGFKFLGVTHEGGPL